MVSNPEISPAELQKVAARIKTLHKMTSEHALEIGRELLRIKEALPHGAFVKWVESECKFKIRMAQNFMSLARTVESNPENAPALVPSTLRLYLSHATPPTVRQLVKTRLENGERVSRRQLHTAIAEARTRRDATTPPTPSVSRESKPDLLAAGDVGAESEIDRAKKIADLLLQRLSQKDYEYVMDGMNWGTWNRVLVWLWTKQRASAKPETVASATATAA